MNQSSIDFTKTQQSNSDISSYDKLTQTCNEAIIIANEKANNLEPWINSASSYLINAFLSDYEKDRKMILNFQTQQKSYNCDTIISEDVVKHIADDFSKDKNKKNAYTYSSQLSKQLLSIIFDYLNHIANDTQTEVDVIDADHILNLDSNVQESSTWQNVPTTYSSRFKNFERDLLINEYPNKREDIDNKGMRGLIYSSSQLFYATSNKHFFVLSYSPANEQYYNQKIKEINKAPSFSFMVFDREVEDFFVENFETINALHRNFMQFTYLADTNQNIVNAMGEASLIAQYWYTESVNRILKDHDKELKKAKDSSQLAEYIIRYILAAEIDGVELIEVYPFDRVFMFNNSIFSQNNDQEKFTVFEGLLESKVPHKDIHNKEFLGGKTQFSYEWEREKTELSFDKFDPSTKKIKKTASDASSLKLNSNIWINDYNKDDETVINNLLAAMLSESSAQREAQMLEYKSTYSEDGITYLYSSGTNLLTQIPALYNLQEHHLHNFVEDINNGITKDTGKNLFKNSEYFDNVKVVMFSYTPENEESSKGFTLILIANEDVPKALMEQKAEKDDLYTALKLLINQHFTIDEKYKEQSIKEQNELIDILTQTKHSIKNSFENFNFNDDIKVLKDKILAIIDQDKIQMMEQGRDATLVNFSQNDEYSTTLQNSFNFLQSLFATTVGSGQSSVKNLNRKFDRSSSAPWDYFAGKIFDLNIDDLKNNRIFALTWKNPEHTQTQLELIIDFNELQNFSFEWKESLFNDAIYVMLKNSCEHSMETYEKQDKKREIFLDIYISNISGQETLNIEFSNSTNKICKDIFTHINKETTIRGNSNKENSTGIGVVTIRKRLDVTYGLERSNIMFTMVNKNTIKSLLYFPIKSDPNDTVFIDEGECNNQANILYLEDSPEYYEPNKRAFNEKGIMFNHDVRYKETFEYQNYTLLVTDLNIFGPNDSTPATSNGEDAILDFIDANKNGVIIVLSSDIDKFDLDNEYKVVHLKDKMITSLERKTIYLSSKKELSATLVSAIKTYSELSNTTVDALRPNPSVQDASPSLVSRSSSFILGDFSTLKTKNSLKNINKYIFRSEVETIQRSMISWQLMQVETKKNRFDFLCNCEIPHKFQVKLLIPVEREVLNSFVLKHETLRRNIVLIFEEDILDDAKVMRQVQKSQTVLIQKKGIFGKISHDILNKMPEFSIYTKEEIEKLKMLNDSVRKEFDTLFEAYLHTNAKIIDKALEKKFLELKEQLQTLKDEAVKKGIHLGTDISNIESILNTMTYISMEVQDGI